MSRAREEADPAKPVSGLRRLMQKIWWLHSFGALGFGVLVMAFARQGLAYADKVLMALGISWIVVFVAFRFIVGPANRKPDERFVKKGVRLVTNYVIKQMYQQMFFFLVPLYAHSAVWSMGSPSWWIVPLLLLCAVLSTMDLVFDNFIMEHRNIAAGMYGLCMFSVLNVLLPLTLHVPHFAALMTAAAITPVAVALLSYPLGSVIRGRGFMLVLLSTIGLGAACYVGRAFVPPAPLSMPAGAIGIGTPGSYECVPGPFKSTTPERLDGLRCVSEVVEPGGINDEIVHVWMLDGKQVQRSTPDKMKECKGIVLRSRLEASSLGGIAKGALECRVETEDGQLLGILPLKVETNALNKEGRAIESDESVPPSQTSEDAGLPFASDASS